MSVFFVYDSAESMDVVLRDHVSNHLFVMLPKVVVTLHKIALGDQKQGQDLITVILIVKPL